VNPRAGMDSVAIRKNSHQLPLLGTEPRSSSPQPSHYTAWGIKWRKLRTKQLRNLHSLIMVCAVHLSRLRWTGHVENQDTPASEFAWRDEKSRDSHVSGRDLNGLPSEHKSANPLGMKLRNLSSWNSVVNYQTAQNRKLHHN
jgi:hypothetical protein